MKAHTSKMVDLTTKKRAVSRFRIRLIGSVFLLLAVLATIIILLLS